MKNILTILFVALALNACDWLFEPEVDPETKAEFDAYNYLVEAHSAKQIWMIRYFELFSNNYKENELFYYEPTAEEFGAFWDEFSMLMEYADSVEIAVSSLKSSEVLLKSTYGFIDSATSFFKWGWNAGKRSRERIQTILTHMKAEHKSQLYDIVENKMKGKVSNETEFWKKLENGDLDGECPTMYNDFYYYSTSSDYPGNNFYTLAIDKGLTPAKITIKEGAEGLKKGSEFYVEAASTAIPTFGKAAEAAKSAKKWWERADKIVDKPKQSVKDEIVDRFKEKIDGFVDVDGIADAVGLGEYIEKGVDQLMKNVENTVKSKEEIKTSTVFGGLQIQGQDNTLKPEIVYAKRTEPLDGLTNIITSIGKELDEFGYYVINLPQGNWNITAFDQYAQKQTTKSVPVSAGQFQKISLGNTTNETPSSQYSKYNAIRIIVEFYDPIYRKDDWLSFIANINNEGDLAPLEWSGNAFSASGDIPNETDSYYEVSFSGVIDQNDAGVTLTLNAIKSKEWIKSETRSRLDETTIKINKVPINQNNQGEFQVIVSSNIIDYVQFSETITEYEDGESIYEVTRTSEEFFKDANNPKVTITFSERIN